MKTLCGLCALLACWVVFVADTTNDAGVTAFSAVGAIIIALCCILLHLTRHED